MADEVLQKELRGNKLKYTYKYTHTLFFKMHKASWLRRSHNLDFIRNETWLISVWELGNEWHQSSGHSQLSPDGATFSRWKLWLEENDNNKCFWAANALSGWWEKGWDYCACLRHSRHPWFRFYRTWKQGFGQNSKTLIILPSSKLSNIW